MTTKLHFAKIWESNSSLVPNEPALVNDNKTVDWRSFDELSSKLASYLIKMGLGEDSKVGIYMQNCNEYMIAQFAAFKIGAVPINVNYRYKKDELIYLFDNSDAEAIIFQSNFHQQILLIQNDLPKVKAFVETSQNDFNKESTFDSLENIMQTFSPLDHQDRSEDEIYMIYTGGTTGMPKGVMYKQGGFVTSMLKTLKTMGFSVPKEIDGLPDEIMKLKEINALPKSLVACPLMHGTGMWLGAFLPLLTGGSVITVPNSSFDPDEIWKVVQQQKVTSLVIVGDAFAKPLLESLQNSKNRNEMYDISSLLLIISSGVMWSHEVKQELLNYQDMILIDAMGSSEGGMGSSITSRNMQSNTAQFKLNPGVIILDEDNNLVTPGSKTIGKIGTSGLVPEGYYKDPIKSAETFREFEGVRYSFPGDFAQYNSDGTIKLLGRGSNCINTAGEKVYPEEVEEAIKKHPNVVDCLVVGVTDKKFGERVAAVASLTKDSFLEEAELIDFVKKIISSYKVPKTIIFRNKIERAPNGKANYDWAKAEIKK
ncbi:MAG: AMP-binding protein [Pseudomonadota bacterium]|nr:AMP-binding protein [Pseudomonadota bacterium]